MVYRDNSLSDTNRLIRVAVQDQKTELRHNGLSSDKSNEDDTKIYFVITFDIIYTS